MKLACPMVAFNALCLFPWLSAHAQSQQPAIEYSLSQEHRITPLEQSRAAEWGLEPQEWRRYRQLMEGPLGLYSPGIDPLTALGIEARDSLERRRYTEMQAHAEYNRLQKLFAYQNAYNETFARLYPNLLPVDLLSGSTAPQASAAIAPDRLAVFVTLDCKGCLERVKQLQGTQQSFDLYWVGAKGNDALIRNWASKAGIDPDKVRRRQITLNHDSGRWSRLGDGRAFPAVMKQVDGRWQRQ